MRKLMAIFAFGLALAAAFTLFEGSNAKTAHAQSGLTYTQIDFRTYYSSKFATITWQANRGEVFAIYRHGQRLAIHRHSRSVSFCAYGNAYWRHIVPPHSQGGYSMYRVNVPSNPPVRIDFPNDLANYLWSAVPKMESALTSASAKGVTGSMPQPSVRKRDSDNHQPQKVSPLPTVLDKPGSVSAAIQEDGSVLVSWSAPANAASDADVTYRIRRRADSGGGKFKVIVKSIADGSAEDANDAVGQIAYRDSRLVADKSYAYSVRAFHPEIKNSKWANKVTAR